MKLIMTEKPNVASDMAKIVGAVTQKEGYYEGNGYLVTWALGHLIGLAEPELYDAKYHNRNDLSNLPIIPKEYKTVIIKETKAQYEVIRALLNRADVDLVIDAGDDGSQGYYLQWLIRRQAGCRKPVKKLFTSSMTDTSIKEGLANLKDIREFEGQIKYAYNAAKEDWLIGMNMSRLYTALYRRIPAEYFTVGRVQTPTLGFVVKRFIENKNFIPADIFSLNVKTDEGINWKLSDKEGNTLSFENETEAEDCARLLQNRYINNIQSKKEQKEKHPPKLYNITLLEREAIRKHGMSAARVLEIAQSLYVKKLITYPRTDSNYITTDMETVFENRIKDLLDENIVYSQFISDGYSFNHFKENKIINNAKVTDHHAILISDAYRGYDMNKLTPDERAILRMIEIRMLLVAAAPCKYTKYSATGSVEEYIAKVSYNKIDNAGYLNIEKILDGKTDDGESLEEDEAFYESSLNVSADRIYECSVKKGKTTAPPLYTEDSLLRQMENAGSTVENEELKDVLKGHGIGTSATRALILKELFDREYIQYKPEVKGKTSKVKSLIPTEKGEYLISIVHPSLKSAELSASLEEQLHMVEEGKMSEAACMAEFEKYITDIIKDEMTKNNVDISKYKSVETDIACYFCKKPLYENGEKYYCNNPGCSRISLYKENNFISNCSRKPMTHDMCKMLMLTGEVKGIECQSKYPGKSPYKANFKINPKFTLQNKENLILMSFDKKQNS